MDRTQTQEFPAALARLEKCLETPVVPGELDLWAHETQRAADQVAALLEVQLHDRHPEVFAEIEQQDSDLMTRVEELRQGDQQSCELLHAFQERLNHLVARADRIEPDEKRGADDQAAIVESGLKFVIQARTQETALETWLMEAVARDRGTGD